MDDFVAILKNRGIYVTINGINIFLCLLRFFKAADFQPKLGIVTRTVGKSFQELAHFFALLSAVCLMYLIFGQVVFGDKIQQFSNLSQSAQTVISWTLSGDDRGAGERLFELPGNLAIAGAVYYTTFALITTLMLLNFLIAIFLFVLVCVFFFVLVSNRVPLPACLAPERRGRRRPGNRRESAGKFGDVRGCVVAKGPL